MLNMPGNMMQALVLSEGRLRLEMIPVPEISEGEALVEVIKAGICRTDLELMKGYMGFEGVLGHEFVGRVVMAAEKGWQGRRVVGEINCACGKCPACLQGDSNHCPKRTVLGIQNRDGVFAQFVSLPLLNLHHVPDTLTDTAAVFVEPLAAAMRIVRQISIKGGEKVLVMGDGKLGLLAAQVIKLHTDHVWCSGRHERKISLLEDRGIRRWTECNGSSPSCFDVIVEATGNPEAFGQALGLIKPRGRLVLKSTYSGNIRLDISRIVVDEVTVIGSRCGPFSAALGMLEKKRVNVETMVDGDFSLSQAMEAFDLAKKTGAIKVLLTP